MNNTFANNDDAQNTSLVLNIYATRDCLYSHRIRIIAAEKDIDTHLIEVNPDDVPEDLLDLNPYGTLPTLSDRDLTLYHPLTMLDYIDDRFPFPQLFPIDPILKSQCKQIIHQLELDWYAAYKSAEDESKSQEAISRLKKKIKELMPILEKNLYLMGEDYGMLDVAISPILWRLENIGIMVPKSAEKIHKYMRRLFSRPSFVASLTDFEKRMHDNSLLLPA